MLKFFYILSLFFIGIIFGFQNSQAQSFVWTRNQVGTNYAYGICTATDKAGNIYVGGHFFGDSVSFGNITIHNSNTSFSDFYFVKYDASGKVLWARSGGGFGNESCTSMAVDANGNIYITGWYLSPTFNLGAFVLNNTADYFYEIFAAKYDSTGKVLWAKSFGGGNDDKGTAIAVDNKGNTFLAGSFKSNSISFGAFTFNNIGPGYEDFFILKLDASGNVTKGKSFGDYGPEVPTGLITDVFGNIYFCGAFFSSSLTFGTNIVNNTGLSDMFVVKMDSVFKVVWSKAAGSTGYDSGAGITKDDDENIYVCGFFKGNIFSIGTTTLSNSTTNNYADIYLAKYDSSGKFIWAKSAGSDKDDYAYATAADKNGDIFVTGSYYGATFSDGKNNFTNSGYEDIFIIKYDQSGNVKYSKAIGSNGSDAGSAAIVDIGNNLIIAGSFSSKKLGFGNDTLTGGNSFQMFVTKLRSNSTFAENSHKDSNDIQVYPNPANEQFTINFGENLKNGFIEIYSMKGELVYSTCILQTLSMEVQRRNLSSGVYLIKVSAADKIFTQKLILN